MSGKSLTGIVLLVVCLGSLGAWYSLRPVPSKESANEDDALPIASSSVPPADPLDGRFSTDVKPFLQRYCFSCHGEKKQEAALDLRNDATTKAVADNARLWELVLSRLESQEMPPEDASSQPNAEERGAVVAWIRDFRDREAERSAGDPGTVLARRLSNAEYDYTIRDLTGVDIRPTREFPVDPANEAGFDNSGESLAMSPARVQKYLEAARLVAGHLVLKPEGFVFAPHPVVTETDRDKYCVQRIVDFYQHHKVDLADYFLAAWNYRQRSRPDAPLSRFATEAGLSVRYLTTIWSILTGPELEVGPLAVVQKLWRDLLDGAPTRPPCERMRDVVLRLRRQLETKVGKVQVNGISNGSQTFILWSNRQRASLHLRYTGDAASDWRKLADQVRADAPLAKLFLIDAASEKRQRATLERFCEVFPDTFVVANQSRPLTAGFHLMQGYFRDDEPLYELVLDDGQRREIDALWDELNFITMVPMRQYKDFIFFERAEPPRFMREAEFDFARSEDKDSTSEEKMSRLAKAYLEKAKKQGAEGDAVEAIETYFTNLSADIRRVERGRLDAEPSHLEALVRFAEKAYRRPLSATDRQGLLTFYRDLRKNDLGHEEALRDVVASILLSPHFSYRVDLAPTGPTAGAVSEYALANRLSYFLWSSMPDAELLSHAAAGDLSDPKVLTAQARRMLLDPRVRGLATEFGGNWLDFRRFEEHNSVDRQRFPAFTNELRQAMFEEPVRYFVDIAKRNRSVLDLLHGTDTFVNRPLAKHYGMPEPPKGSDAWVHVTDANRFGRGGMLPMAVFLTRNAPGLRTSPVKRGYWVVRRLLGEHIPPPPPTVAELPQDEAKLGSLTLPQLLARHREDKSCAGCHRRFDSVGLAFEGFGPVGERRALDLGGHPVQTEGTFPDGKDRKGLDGLREYLRDKRQDDFIDNLCKKLFTFALGRGVRLSDKKVIEAMKAKLVADGHAFGGLVEVIVTSPQFRNKRGQDDPREQ